MPKEPVIPSTETPAAPPSSPEAEAPEETEKPSAAVTAAADEGELQETPKPKGGFQRRIDKLTREREDQAREAEFWRKKALEVPTPASPAKPTEADEAEPNFEDYPDWGTFLKAQQAWVRRVADKAARSVEERISQAESQRQKETQQREQQQQWEKREQAAKGKFDDFEEKAEDCLEALTAARGKPGMQLLRDVVLQGDPSGEFEYYLGTNPEEVSRIAALMPMQVLVEVGKVFSKFATPESAVLPPTTKAPPPPTPVRKAGPGSSPKPDDPASDKLPVEEWMKARKAQVADRQRRR
jgi:hypothetical protein